MEGRRSSGKIDTGSTTARRSKDGYSNSAVTRDLKLGVTVVFWLAESGLQYADPYPGTSKPPPPLFTR